MDASRPAVPDFEELYDEQVLARIDAGPGRPAHVVPVDDDVADEDVEEAAGGSGRSIIPRYPVARRIGAAVVAGALLGVADVLEPERVRHHIIDYVPDVPDEDTQLVTFHMVPGDPRASRLVVRPWLLERFRARRS